MEDRVELTRRATVSVAILEAQQLLERRAVRGKKKAILVAAGRVF